MNNTVKTFIKRIADELNYANEIESYDKRIDIPFVISTLSQHLEDEKYKIFVDDLNKYNYHLNFEDTDGYYCGKLTIYLKDLDYTYTTTFYHDTRHWGYCECMPNNEDYREDKQCCGHGCDWDAPAFNIVKEIPLGYSSWDGDEHDYWEFEDNFYKSNKELAEEKDEREKQNKINYIEQQMKDLQEELNKLKGE